MQSSRSGNVGSAVILVTWVGPHSHWLNQLPQLSHMVRRALTFGLHLGDDPMLFPIAIRFGQITLLQWLLRQNEFNVNLSNGCDGKPPLCVTAERGNVEAMSLLLDHGANVSVRDRDGMTPVDVAAGATTLFLDAGSRLGDPHSDDIAPLEKAVMSGHCEVVLMLPGRGTSIASAIDVSPVHIATFSGHALVLGLLLMNGGDIEARTDDGGTPLAHAVEREMAAAVKILLEHEADIKALSPGGISHLRVACEVGNVRIAEILLEHGADLSDEDPTPQTFINVAAAKFHAKLVEVLMSYEGRIEDTDVNRFTPLIVASSDCCVATARKRLVSGANVEATLISGHTALQAATINGRTDVVELLLKHGANTAVLDAVGRTPAHLAASNGHFTISNYSPKFRTSTGETTVGERPSSTPQYAAAMTYCPFFSTQTWMATSTTLALVEFRRTTQATSKTSLGRYPSWRRRETDMRTQFRLYSPTSPACRTLGGRAPGGQRRYCPTCAIAMYAQGTPNMACPVPPGIQNVMADDC